MTIAIFATVALVLIAWEFLYPVRTQPFFRRGFFADAGHLLVNVALRFVFTGAPALLLNDLGTHYLPEGWTATLRDEPLWLQIVAVVVVLDFCFYWMHRAKHSWQWWWRLHETHHSSVDLDWFSSVRFHPLEKILDRFLYLLPLLVLGVSEQALIGLAAVDAVVASLIHSNARVRMGPLIYLFNGPEMHRWHHARAEEHQRRNFGNNLSIFDWIFGTARVSYDDPQAFGVEDSEYPVGNWARQVLYAFRRLPEATPQGEDLPVPGNDTTPGTPPAS